MNNEDDLNIDKKRLEALFKNSSSAIAVLDNNHCIKDINQSFKNIFGYELEDVKGKNLDIVLGLKNTDQNLTQAVLAGRKVRKEGTRYDKDGNPKRFIMKGIPIIIDDVIDGVFAIYEDITELKERKKQLELTQFAVDKADILVFRLTSEGIISYVNDKVCECLGYSREELIGMENKNLIPESQFKEQKKFWVDIKKNGSLTFKKDLIKKDGNTFPVKMTTHLFKYKGEEYEFSFGHNISEQEKAKKKINYLSFHDNLTAIYNRAYMEREMEKLNTKSKLPISLIMMDVNGLELINETYGHKKGDELLIKVSDFLKSIVGQGDILARWAGDEFIILMSNTTKNESEILRNRITAGIKNIKFDHFEVSLGIGIAVKNDNTGDLHDLIYKATKNMNQDKLTNSSSSKNQFVKNLLNTLAAKSDETKEHAERMTSLAVRLGKEINLTHEELNNLSLIATLHDIGKVTIAEEILNKPGKLNKKEWKLIKKHPEKGASIAASTEQFASIAKYILYHHERWDGDGYIEGLEGESIPLLSRIIAIIDSYDVMTNKRAYKITMTKAEALEEIISCSGTQFDPELGEIFVQMMSE